MGSNTIDGYKVTSIEQAGEYKGQKIGRVLLIRKDDDDYDYWTLGSVKRADYVVNQAPTMIRKEFEDYMDRLQAERLHPQAFLYDALTGKGSW
jgi:hypothetical protein